MKLSMEKAPYLVVTELEFLSGQDQEIIDTWESSDAKGLLDESVLYRALKKNTLVLLYKISSFNQLQNYTVACQEDTAYNGHYKTTGYHPLLAFDGLQRIQTVQLYYPSKKIHFFPPRGSCDHFSALRPRSNH